MPEFKIILPKKNFHVIADLKKRGLAFLIDIIIFFFFIFSPFLSLYYDFAGVPVEKLTVDSLFETNDLLKIIMIGDFACFSLFYLYLVCSELLLSATIGKRMMNLSVVSKDHKKLTLFQLMIRNLSKSYFWYFLFFDSFLMFTDKERRRILDFVSNTLVVENRKRIKKFPVINEV